MKSYLCLLFAWVWAFYEATAQTKFAVFIPSEAAGTTGVAAEVTIPAKARYGVSAPVVIHFLGGFSAGDISFGNDMAQYGFIEIRFLYPGGSDTIGGRLVRSGGVYDTRGIQSLRALRDLVKFALGQISDTQGKKLSDYAGSVKPLAANVGLFGSSNGGNATIALAGALGQEISQLAWIVNWESPVGDGVANAEAGSKQSGLNPAYNTSNNTYDFTKLKYNDTLSAGMLLQGAGRPAVTLRGGLYFDINGNGTVDASDFKLAPRADTVSGKTRAYFSNAALEAAYNANLFPAMRPSHIPTLQENRDYWQYRNGESWFDAAVRNLPHLMFTVVASVEDHVQIAPNYPHIVIQYEGFRKAKARFVRLNGDRAYTELALGRTVATAADNEANASFDYATVKNALQPSGAGPNGLRGDVTITGAILELADRTQTNNLSPNLNAVISVPTSVREAFGYLNMLSISPNPASSLVSVRFYLEKSERVSLKIYNMLGQEVVQILDVEMPQGNHEMPISLAAYPQSTLILRLETTSSAKQKLIHILH